MVCAGTVESHLIILKSAGLCRKTDGQTGLSGKISFTVCTHSFGSIGIWKSGALDLPVLDWKGDSGSANHLITHR